MSWFNATQHTPDDSGFKIFDVGNYPMRVVAGERKANKENTGTVLTLEYEFLDGKYQGQRYQDRFNIQHPDSATVSRSLNNLAALAYVVNVIELASPNGQELFGQTFIGALTHSKDKDTNQPKGNWIKYMTTDGRTGKDIATGGGRPTQPMPAGGMPQPGAWNPQPNTPPQPQPGFGAPMPQQPMPPQQPAPGAWQAQPQAAPMPAQGQPGPWQAQPPAQPQQAPQAPQQAWNQQPQAPQQPQAAWPQQPQQMPQQPQQPPAQGAWPQQGQPQQPQPAQGAPVAPPWGPPPQ